MTAREDSDAHGKEVVAAAQEIYERLQNGTYLNWGEEERPIAGDLAKVTCAASLSPKATILLANMRCVSTQHGGVQEILAMPYLEHVWFMANLFSVIISPSRRRSGLVMRLSRVRANYPLLGHADMPFEEAQRIGGASCPLLEMEEDVLVDLPEYDAPKCWRARD